MKHMCDKSKKLVQNINKKVILFGLMVTPHTSTQFLWGKRIRAGVKDFKKELHIYIHLDQAKINFLS